MIGFSIFLLGLLLSPASAQLRVVTLPNILFQNRNANHKIVSGSVIQLYCSATSMTGTPSITWVNNGVNLVNNPPHIRIRSSSNNTMNTTSSLTIDYFTSEDDGNYVCHATDGSTALDKSTTLIINAFSTFTGVLTITRDPATREVYFEDNMINPLDNRTAVTLGSTVDQVGTPDYDNVLRCVCGHVGDTTNFNFDPPSVVWVKNGEEIVTDSRITITDSGTWVNGVRRASILRISNFQLSDVGVYQCIFTDVDSDHEVATTTPLRLDTGDTLQLERVSPEEIILDPPEKLVIEMHASGGYRQIEWRKNAVLFNATNRSNTFFVRLPDEFSSFFEIFVREPTTMNDQGLYEVYPIPANTEQTEASPVHYVVTLYEAPITMSRENTTVTAFEGGSTEISCTSSGNPIPTISWELDGSPAPFPQSDTVTRYPPTVPNFGEFSFTTGSVTSELKITGVNTSHEGEYTCTARNSHRGLESSTSSTITVRVLVIPVIEVTASLPVLQLGDSITLTCSVTRAIPSDYTFTWTHDSTPLPETGNTLTFPSVRQSDLGVYRCSVTDSAGTGSGTFNLQIGNIGTPTATGTGTTSQPTTVVSTGSTPSITTIVAVVSIIGGGIILLLVTIIIILIVAIAVMGQRKFRMKRAKDKDDSKLIPFEELPFGITPADDQYVYGQQALNWNERTLTFGEDTLGEHTFDEDAFDENMFDETPNLIN